MTKGRTQTAPIDVGSRIELAVHDIGHKGEGVGRYQGLAVFVPKGVPGDRLLVRITEVKKRYARAELVQVIEPSPDRVRPRCPVTDRCGGCQLQHIAYRKQLELKRNVVAANITRIGRLKDVVVHPTLGMAEPWNYRNKAQYPFGVQSGRVIAGFFAPGSHDLIDIDVCDIQHPVGDAIMRAVKELADVLAVPIYDERSHTGVLRHVLTRIGRGGREAMAVLVTNGPDLPHARELAAGIMERVPEVVSVVQNINPYRTNVILGDASRLLAGRPYITDTIGDLEFKISPVSFFQVNPAQTEVLYAKVLEYAALTGRETVIDLYCGIGTITLFLARQAREAIGIEWIEEAVRDARANAEHNGITNVRFIAGDASREMPKLVRDGVRVDVVVLDPPRKGCDEPVLEAAAAAGPHRIVYVSCNPASLARDLERLHALGYRTVEVQPVDMFPHTAHIECCALLVKA